MFMETKSAETFLTALGEKKQQQQADGAALTASSRQDEGNLKKAAANIYEIYEQMWNRCLSRRRVIGDDAAAAEFEKLLTTIPENWKTALEKARSHDDFARVAVEEAKLAALNDILWMYAAAKGAEK